MTKDRKYFYILGALVLILVLVEYFKPQPIDWTPTLSSKDKIPFGTFILHDILSDIFPESEVVTLNNTLFEMREEQAGDAKNIFILASNFAPDSLDMDALFSMVAAGDHAFIGANFFGSKFADTLKLETGFDLKEILTEETQLGSEKDSANLHFVNPQLDTSAYYYQVENASDYFSSIDTARATILAVNEGKKPVYIKVPWGKGALYLSSVPLAYTNYYLLKNDNYEYVSQSLSYLPVADVQWTEYYQIGRFESGSPLRFVLNNASLRWAFYITFIGLIGFIIFESKRKQRVIPVVTPPRNTTLEFVKTVGNLFYRTKNHKNIAHKKITYFLNHIRMHYRIDTSSYDEEFREKLSKKSGQSQEDVDALIHLIQKLEGQKDVSKQELLALNQKIDVFYQNLRNL